MGVFINGCLCFLFLGNTLVEENGKIDESDDNIFYNGQFLGGGAHGALFHLAALTYYSLVDGHWEYELASSEEIRVVGFYKSENDRKNSVIAAQYKRYVDILLKDKEGQEVWVELKSLKRPSGVERSAVSSNGLKAWGKEAKPISKWKGSKSKYNEFTYTKQFNIDRAATVSGAFPVGEEGNTAARITPADFWWRFQEFTVKAAAATKDAPKRTASYSPTMGPTNASSVSAADKHSIRYLLTVLPEKSILDRKELNASLGVKDRDNDTKRQAQFDRIDLLNGQTAIMEYLQNSDILEDLVKEAMQEALVN